MLMIYFDPLNEGQIHEVLFRLLTFNFSFTGNNLCKGASSSLKFLEFLLSSNNCKDSSKTGDGEEELRHGKEDVAVGLDSLTNVELSTGQTHFI